MVLPIKFQPNIELGKFIEGIENDIYKYLSLNVFTVRGSTDFLILHDVVYKFPSLVYVAWRA